MPEIKCEFDLELDDVCDHIRRKGYRTVGIQLPEGLKSHGLELAERIEGETNATVLLDADPCWGACDLADHRLKELGAEFLVHYGHAPLPLPTEIPARFVEARSTVDVGPVVREALPLLPHKRVGLVTTVQHAHRIPEVEAFLAEQGVKPVIGYSKTRARGQVLGCDLTAATSIAKESEGYLYIGSGNFHPLGIALATDLPVLIADPCANEVRGIEELKDRVLRQRYTAIALAGEAKTMGIIVGTKKGQQQPAMAKRFKKEAESRGCKAYLIAASELRPERLTFKVDVWVCTACPRVAIDDYSLYHQPILTPQEAEVALGIRPLESVYGLD